MYFGIAGLAAKSSELITFAQNLLTFAGGIFLFSGLWTPVIAGLVALEEVYKMLRLHRPLGESALIHIVLAALAFSLAMLGRGRLLRVCSAESALISIGLRGGEASPKRGKNAFNHRGS